MIVVLARVFLAVVFVVSAVAKLRDREGSRKAVGDFGVPATLVSPVASLLPAAELASAALLVSADPAATAGSVLALLLLTAFTTAVVVNVRRGNPVECHCFGQVTSSVIGWPTVARNAGLLVLAGASLVGAGNQGSVPAELADYSGIQLAAGTGVLLLVAAVVVLGFAVYTLTARYGAVLLRIEALEFATGTAEPAVAPAFALPDLEGRDVVLAEVLSEGRPVLLVFVSTRCTLCGDLLPELAQWQATPQLPLRVLVASDDTVAANRAKMADTAPSLELLLFAGSELSRDYGLDGTPGAVLIGVDGRLASPMTYGVSGIRALTARTTQAMAAAERPPQAHQHGQGAPGGLALHQVVPRPVQAGDRLPALDVDTESGERRPLAELMPDETVLLFWRTTCGYCARIVDDVQALESSVSLALLTGSTSEEIRASGLRSPIVRDPDQALNTALQVPGTPAAVAVRSGVLTSPMALGGPDVLALLRSRTSQSVPDTATARP